MHFARDEKTKSSESCSPAVRGGVAVVMGPCVSRNSACKASLGVMLE